ncbi:enkurin-like [Takifugu flavidus]|uniref:enkurin-like n=1 Tax=Takifugu flavidus TaxID=433684 RepID=UPI00254466CE|nr:enkurin-like [Takifugu flavidus]
MDNISVLAKPYAKVHTCTPRYVSKFRLTVLLEAKANKQAKKTMGPPNEELPDPRNYLKKHAAEHRTLQKLDVERHSPHDNKPPIPPMIAQLPLKSPSDFVKEAVHKEYKTTQPTPKCAVNRNGDKVVVENFGRPIHVKRKDYGLMPLYLQKHNEKEKKDKEAAIRAERELKENIVRGKLEEQQATLECLKKLWSKLNEEYCHLPLIIETRRLINNKKYLEERLAWVEKSIQYMEKCRARHPFHAFKEPHSSNC